MSLPTPIIPSEQPQLKAGDVVIFQAAVKLTLVRPPFHGETWHGEVIHNGAKNKWWAEETEGGPMRLICTDGL